MGWEISMGQAMSMAHSMCHYNVLGIFNAHAMGHCCGPGNFNSPLNGELQWVGKCQWRMQWAVAVCQNGLLTQWAIAMGGRWSHLEEPVKAQEAIQWHNRKETQVSLLRTCVSDPQSPTSRYRKKNERLGARDGQKILREDAR